MNLGLSLTQRPEMQLRLSPQLIQRIEILQLPSQELLELVRQECSENETLEVDASPSELTAAQNGSANGTTQSDVELDDQVSANLERYTGYNEILRAPVRSTGERDAKMEAMQNTPSGPQSLQDHLMSQVAYANVPMKVRGFVEILIQHLDENGFLGEPLEEILIPNDTEYSMEDARQALEYLKTLDPPGVGALDMRECFLIQLDESHPRFELHRQLISDHLDDWRENRLPKIAKATGVTIEEVKEAMEDLKLILTPPPGRQFRQEVVIRVRPDVVVEKIDDRYKVRLEDDVYPQVSLNQSFIDLYRERGLSSKQRKELKAKIEKGRFLIEAIEQRKSTLRNVAREIVGHQEEFFETGTLRPLKMRDVADTLGLHVSTVSRAISEKWMQSPGGVYPLKHFFIGAAPGGNSAGDESRDTVRQKVSEIISAEDKKKPLSDEDLVVALKEQGVDVARRTVTKYRKMLNIPSSRQRREY